MSLNNVMDESSDDRNEFRKFCSGLRCDDCPIWNSHLGPDDEEWDCTREYEKLKEKQRQTAVPDKADDGQE